MVTCIGCCCDDENACIGGCHWVAVRGALGICSKCADDFDDHAAMLEQACAEMESFGQDMTRDDGAGLITPDDPEFHSTLRHL
jgi:hypothetical protein